MSAVIERTTHQGLIERLASAFGARHRLSERRKPATDIDSWNECNHHYDYPAEMTQATIERYMQRAYSPRLPYGG